MLPLLSLNPSCGHWAAFPQLPLALSLLLASIPASWMADLRVVGIVAVLLLLWWLPTMLSHVGRTTKRRLSLKRTESRFLAASEGSSDAFFILQAVRNKQGEIIDFRYDFVNQRGARLLSTTSTELEGKLLCEHLPMNRTDGFFDEYKRVVETGISVEREFPICHPEIQASWLRYQVVKLEDGVAISTTDISARKEAEMKMSRLVTFTQSIIASSPFATVVTDLDGVITAVNPAAERMLWHLKEDLIGKCTPLDLLNPHEVQNRAITLTRELKRPVLPGMDVFRAKPQRGLVEEAEWQLFRRDGSHFDAQMTVSALTDATGEMVGLIFLAYDITERKRTEDYISHLAHHDALTTLPTRTLLHDRLHMSLSRANRENTKVGLLMVDLDNFKRVNDLMGHHIGDELLKSVARKLQATLRASDTVARMGGDEFVVLLADMHDVSEAETLARKIVTALATPVVLNGHTLNPTASVGICVYPDNAENAEALLKNADVAMYHVKADGRNGFQTFTYSMASESNRKRTLEAGLHQAVARNELELAYQPQISMTTGRVIGVEALLRWHSQKLGLVMPTEFIPLAEESGLIVPIGEWVIRNACLHGRELQHLLGEPVTIAINVSPRQFHQDNLVNVIKESLEESGLDPATLELEITENILVSDSPKPMSVLEQIRALGVRVAIDDFGTGFSSMSYIMRFRVDRLKIDRSFIRNMTVSADSRAVTSAVIALASGLNITVVAEGVETLAHRDLLLSKGCDEAQGNLYSKPVPFHELKDVIGKVHKMLATTALPNYLAAPGVA